MKTLYLDCFAGIAGDMFIGALLNLVPSHKILTDGIAEITALDKSEYELVIENADKNGIAGINFDVKLKHEHEHEHEHGHHHHHRHLADIEAMIYSSGLNAIRDKGSAEITYTINSIGYIFPSLP